MEKEISKIIFQGEDSMMQFSDKTRKAERLDASFLIHNGNSLKRIDTPVQMSTQILLIIDFCGKEGMTLICGIDAKEICEIPISCPSV